MIIPISTSPQLKNLEETGNSPAQKSETQQDFEESESVQMVELETPVRKSQIQT